ncbi:hypothetical protein [Rhodanobacter sp. Root179]|uniref:hypothetical protein n=1 Tax=Rhodanobacter sp. Root179 TaxID=1736482 RepID=UPI00138F5925|nr:hypothetical protein [Rhodanobacter sp. Root179]
MKNGAKGNLNGDNLNVSVIVQSVALVVIVSDTFFVNVLARDVAIPPTAGEDEIFGQRVGVAHASFSLDRHGAGVSLWPRTTGWTRDFRAGAFSMPEAGLANVPVGV